MRDDCLLEGFAQTFLEIISIHVTQSHESAVGSRRIECAGDGLASLLLKFLVRPVTYSIHTPFVHTLEGQFGSLLLGILTKPAFAVP